MRFFEELCDFEVEPAFSSASVLGNGGSRGGIGRAGRVEELDVPLELVFFLSFIFLELLRYVCGDGSS